MNKRNICLRLFIIYLKGIVTAIVKGSEREKEGGGHFRSASPLFKCPTQPVLGQPKGTSQEIPLGLPEVE